MELRKWGAMWKSDGSKKWTLIIHKILKASSNKFVYAQDFQPKESKNKVEGAKSITPPRTNTKYLA